MNTILWMKVVLWTIFIVFVVFIVLSFIFAVIRNNRIRKNGIKTEAVISRIEEIESTDADGLVDTNYRYYVTYQTKDGETVEARLGKLMQVHYHEGETLDIMYMPDQTDYVVPVK